MKSLEERKADRIRRNAENRAEENTSPSDVAESGEATGKKGKAKKGAGKIDVNEKDPADPAGGNGSGATDLAGAGNGSPGWGAAS